LAIDIWADAYADGLRFDFTCGDGVYFAAGDRDPERGVDLANRCFCAGSDREACGGCGAGVPLDLV